MELFQHIFRTAFICFILTTPCHSQYPPPPFPDYYPEFNRFESAKKLGAFVEKDSTFFRLFAPRATKVLLELYTRHDSEISNTYHMQKDEQGVWEFQLPGDQSGLYYAYRVHGPEGPGEMFDSTIVITDPYARAVTTQNNYHHNAKGIIWNQSFDWENDTWMTYPVEDLIIYEMHVRDMTAHPTSGVAQRGTYSGLCETGKRGGLDYLKSLGINAVELLPCHEFANIEPPYNDSTTTIRNTWNPYARNHWGYMTSYFFAPESYYATDGSMEPDAYSGIRGRQVNELKAMIKTLHQNGIAVILDVVYNHVSQYDYNPLKYIDKKYYFRLDSTDQFLSYSGCGNDLMTERPMARRLILESVRYWMTEYHVDGFRFDLATLIDRQTCQRILAEARAINPNVYIIAEPWGGGYDPMGFADIGWAAWNDKFRNAVKGQNPFDNPGFIFGKWERENSQLSIRRYPTGTLRNDGGLFRHAWQSINYLASHDDYTLGDFIRIGTGEVDPHQRRYLFEPIIRLTPGQLRLHKLGAIFLLTSQGPVMIHAGQEFARSKCIAFTADPDTNQGRIDHNSYNKDNETNYINYDHITWNRSLVDYYRGLIALRNQYSLFRKVTKKQLSFLDMNHEFGLGYHIRANRDEAIVLLNAHPHRSVSATLPDGSWTLLVDAVQAGLLPIRADVKGNIVVPPSSGMVLIKE